MNIMDNNNNKLKINVTAYKCNLGSTQENLVYSEVIAGPGISPSANKEIIFVVDLSGSMRKSIPALKASLLAFRDAILNRNLKTDKRNSMELEMDWRNLIAIDLIGFNEEAKLLYTSAQEQNSKANPNLANLTIMEGTAGGSLKSMMEDTAGGTLESMMGVPEELLMGTTGETLKSMKAGASYETGATAWNETISKLGAGGTTNMGDAIKLAFEKTNPKKFTWIVVLTDGESNVGRYQTIKSFKSLVEETPSNTKIVALGYGKEFNVDVLTAIGEFTYVKNKEQIPLVFGSLANEYLNSWGFNALWGLDNYPGNNVDALRRIIGHNSIGCLYNERRFATGFTVPNEDFYPFINGKLNDKNNKGRIMLTYTDISTMNTIKIIMEAKFKDGNVPSKILSDYYSSAKERRLNKIYAAISSGNNMDKFLKEVKNDVEKWTADEAKPHREDILVIIDKLLRSSGDNKETSLSIMSRCSDSKKQSSHANKDMYTPTQVDITTNTANSSNAYLMAMRRKGNV